MGAEGINGQIAIRGDGEWDYLCPGAHFLHRPFSEPHG